MQASPMPHPLLLAIALPRFHPLEPVANYHRAKQPKWEKFHMFWWKLAYLVQSGRLWSETVSPGVNAIP